MIMRGRLRSGAGLVALAIVVGGCAAPAGTTPLGHYTTVLPGPVQALGRYTTLLPLPAADTAADADGPTTTTPPSTTTTTTTTALAPEPTEPAPPPDPPPAEPPPTAVSPTSVVLDERPTAGIPTWPCQGPTDPADPTTAAAVTERRRTFEDNVSISGLPTRSQRQVLAQIPRVEAGLPLYCAAEAATGVPALVLAAIHYREADNDPTRSIMSGEALGAVNPDTGIVEGTDPLDNAIRAARHLSGNAWAVYGVAVGPRMTTAELAYAAAAYNRGNRYCRAAQMHPMRSPYVAGGLIERYVGMSWPDVGSENGASAAAWGEPPSVRGRPDRRIGLITLMRGLGSEITAPAYAWDTDEVQIRCRR